MTTNIIDKLFKMLANGEITAEQLVKAMRAADMTLQKWTPPKVTVH